MKSLIKKLTGQKGLGLVEVLVALGIVGSGMVIITQVSLRTIKQARKNELQDVANQLAVEALDFMKMPADITMGSGDIPGYFKLDFDPVQIVKGEDNEISNCYRTGDYYVDLGYEGYVVCQQIYLEESSLGSDRYDFQVKVVWETVGGEFEEITVSGHRVGAIK